MSGPGERLPRVPVRRLLAGLLVVELLGIAWLVLNPSPTTPSEVVHRISGLLARFGLPGWLAGSDQVEFALNIALFVPLTALAAMLWTRVPVWGWALLGFALSSALEWLQLAFLSERSSTSRDIIANTLGALLGAGAVALSRFGQDARWWGAHPAAARRPRSR